MINLSWLVRKRKLRLTLEAIWVTTTSLTLSSHVTMETFFFTVLMSFFIWGGGGSLMDQLVLYLQTIYPTEKLSQAWCRGKKDTTSSFWERKGLGRYIPHFLPSPLCAAHSEGVQANRKHIFLRPWANLSSGQSDWQRPKGNKHLEGCLLKTLHCSRAKWLRSWRSRNHDLKL